MEAGAGVRDLQARVEELHGVSLDRVLGEIEYLRDAGDSVIAGGSLAYGLGNHLSDLDLIVTGPTTLESSRIPLEHFIGPLRVDVWKLAQKLVEESFVHAEAALSREAPLAGAFGDIHHEDELKLLHRVAFGVVIDGPGLRPSPGREYHAVASSLVVREYVERMRTSAILAQLSVKADRPIAAVVNARLMVEEALNARAIARGLPFSGDKWLRERLRGELGDLGSIYAPFGQLPLDPAPEADQFVKAAVESSATLWGIDLGIAALAPVARWRNSDLRLRELAADQFLLSTRFNAMWSLDQREAAIWSGLASAGAEVAGAAWGLRSDDDEELCLCLRLHEHGLLELDWIDGVKIEGLEKAAAATA